MGGWLEFKKSYISKNTPVPTKLGADYFMTLGSLSGITWGNNYTDQQALSDFLEIPELNAILNIKANMAANGIRQILNKRTLEPTDNYDPNVRVLRSPNWFQSEKELRKQANLFKYVFGNKYLFFLRPFGMNTIKAEFALPPQNVNIDKLDEIPFLSAESLYKYSLIIGQNKIPIETKNIIHLNDNNIKFDVNNTGNYLKGISKQSALQTPLNNIRAAYEARNMLITNRGAMGILSNRTKDASAGSIPLDSKEKKDLQDDFRQYGITKGQYHTIITNLELEYQQMGKSTRELMLFEEIVEDTTKICDAHGIAYELLAKEKNDTFTNKTAAEKATYQNTIIPEAQEEDSVLNKFFDTDNKSWFIKTTFDHLPVFQEDIKQRSQSLNLLVSALDKVYAGGVITLEQYQAELKKFGI